MYSLLAPYIHFVQSVGTLSILYSLLLPYPLRSVASYPFCTVCWCPIHPVQPVGALSILQSVGTLSILYSLLLPYPSCKVCWPPVHPVQSVGTLSILYSLLAPYPSCTVCRHPIHSVQFVGALPILYSLLAPYPFCTVCWRPIHSEFQPHYQILYSRRVQSLPAFPSNLSFLHLIHV